MNTAELNKYFSVNNLYDNTIHNSRLLQFMIQLAYFGRQRRRGVTIIR